MAITVKHKFVSPIPDAGDPTIVQPSNWNDTHELSGLGTMAEQDANNVAITGGTISGVAVSGYVPTTRTISAGTGLTGGGDLSANRTLAIANTGATAGTYGSDSRSITQVVNAQGQITSIYDQPIAIAYTAVSGLGTAATKDAGVANGVATLDGSGTVPISQLPAAVLGALSYQGTWNASTNTPTLTSSVGTKGYYYVVNVAGTTNLNGITDWQVGDWAVFNGSTWQKIDNTDAVTSVNGYTGTVVLTYTDVGAFPATSTTGTGSVVLATSPTISGPTIDGANPYIQFNNGSAVTVAAGKLWYDGSTGSWNAGMGGGNITQQIGEELFVYGKASTAITDSPLKIVYQTGTVGASGTITFAPTVAGITNGDLILGCATEAIALNGFGRITSFGVIHGITTNGTAYGETWANGDTIWYNPVTGNPTNIKPSAPNIKVSVGTIINAGSGGSGSIQVEINHGSVLGGTDSNVQLTSVANGNILTYDGADSYWKNTALTAGTAISVSASSTGVLTVANTAPDQTVAIASGTGISVTGTYPNFTVTNTSPSSGGTVTSVSGTAPVSVATGTTTPVISLATGYGDTQNPYASKTANYFLAAPNGSAGAPTFRAIVAADIPTLNQNTTGSSGSCTGNAATVTNGFYTTSSFYLGTTSIAVNRASASQSLTGISIDGNAGTVTNGVYTTGSYADPTWITSLAGSKITGTIDGGTF